MNNSPNIQIFPVENGFIINDAVQGNGETYIASTLYEVLEMVKAAFDTEDTLGDLE